jgi:hypothetical protein
VKEMKLKKRDCPIKIKLFPTGSQYLGVDFDFYGEKLYFNPSSVMSGQFGDFLSALYTLFLDENTDPEWSQRRYHSYEDHEIYAVTTTVEWDNEGQVMKTEITRTYATDTDKDVLLKATTDYGETYKIFHLNFKDLCYAVAKACTEALKDYGFFGYRYSTEYDWFKIHQLLFIKAYALDDTESRELIATDSYKQCFKTDFEKEMELLLFDM